MKVWPKNDEMRKILKHPTGVPFPAEGPADWPEDTFTHRRINDGDVTLDEPKVVTPPPRAKSKDDDK